MPLVDKRYAEALIRIAVQNNSIDAFEQDLGLISSTINENTDLKKFLLNPSQSDKSKKDAVEKIFSKSINKNSINFLKLLIDKGRIDCFDGIKTTYKELADEIRKCLDLTVISYSELPESQIKTIGDKFKAQYKSKDVKINKIVDSSIIGGVIVKIGDKMIDGSVKGKLEGMLNSIG